MTIDNNTMKVLKWGAIIGAGIAAILVGKKIYNNIKSNKEINDYQKTLDNKVNESTKVIKATLTKDRATEVAEHLYTAMADMGTDEDAIRAELVNIKNWTDWAMVEQAFGKRAYGSYGKPLISWDAYTDNLDLMDWFRRECSDSLLKHITTLRQSYLTAYNLAKK